MMILFRHPYATPTNSTVMLIPNFVNFVVRDFDLSWSPTSVQYPAALCLKLGSLMPVWKYGPRPGTHNRVKMAVDVEFVFFLTLICYTDTQQYTHFPNRYTHTQHVFCQSFNKHNTKRNEEGSTLPVSPKCLPGVAKVVIDKHAPKSRPGQL